MATDPKTATGVGAASSHSSAGMLQPRAGVRANVGENAMTSELQKIQAETDAIAARHDMDDATKNKMIADLNHPDRMRERMKRARDLATGKIKA